VSPVAQRTKLSASARTVDMFPAEKPMEHREVEVLQGEEKAARVSMEEDADRLREQAFSTQAWATKAFGTPEAKGNEYRVSHRGDYYYLETLAKQPGAATAYGYVGVVLHERDLLNAVTVLVQAVREKQKNDAK